MHRAVKPDETLERLGDERDQLAIQISLANDAENPDLGRVEALRRSLAEVERQIRAYRPANG